MLLDASSCSMFIFQCSIFDSISSSFFRIDILMSAEKNVLKLTRDHMDFNLNLKTILSPLFDAQKSVYTKKKNHNWNFWYFGLIFSIRHFHLTWNTGGKRIEIMS